MRSMELIVNIDNKINRYGAAVRNPMLKQIPQTAGLSALPPSSQRETNVRVGSKAANLVTHCWRTLPFNTDHIFISEIARRTLLIEVRPLVELRIVQHGMTAL